MKSLLTAIASLTLLFTSNAWAGSPHGIEAHAPWVREAPPAATVLAAYLQLHNHSDKTHTLIGVQSAGFQHVELHRSAEKEGMATMAKISQVMIPGHGKVAFKPGGLHIMLIKPLSALTAGNIVTLTLTFRDGSSLDVDAEVRRDVLGNNSGGKAHHHGSSAAATPTAPAAPATTPHNHGH